MAPARSFPCEIERDPSGSMTPRMHWGAHGFSECIAPHNRAHIQFGLDVGSKRISQSILERGAGAVSTGDRPEILRGAESEQPWRERPPGRAWGQGCVPGGGSLTPRLQHSPAVEGGKKRRQRRRDRDARRRATD
jgi:hypothetical protein